MKEIYLLIVFVVIAINIAAQNVGIGTPTPNGSAMLEIKASDRGLLIPRTSTSSRLAIFNPAKGLLIYDSTTGGFWFHNGSAWSQIPGNSWSLTGNAGINPVTNFIGTVDNQPLKFKVNNIDAGSIYPNGNLFLGIGSSNPAVSGTSNTGIGQSALSGITTGEGNTALGAASLSSNTTGNLNTAVGIGAMLVNETGSGNTATGYSSLLINLSGNSNTANGYASLENNETGNANTAGGYNSLLLNSTGNYNTGVGHSSLFTNSTGNYNTATGSSSLYSNTTGNHNTANGYFSLSNNTTGSNNTAIGYNANTSAGNLTNATAIGQGAIADASNKVVLGNSAVSLVQTSGIVQSKGLYVTADATAKDNSALLEVKSTSKGILIPRLDTAQINGIVQPANGLIVYCTTYNKPVYWDGTYWFFFDGSRMKPVTLGEYFGGGVVFYVDGSGRHGLIAAGFDVYGNYQWGLDGRSTAYHAAVGSGQGNTLAIVSYSSIFFNGVTAAKACDDLVLNGFTDWFLPSKDELFLLYLNRWVLQGYGYESGPYWSSTRSTHESTPDIWVQLFDNMPNNQFTATAGSICVTRAIRAF